MDVVTYALAKKKAAGYTDSKVAGLGSGFNYKGSVATIEDLPSSAEKGDEYTVGDIGSFVWDGSAWKPAGVKGPQGEQGEQGEQGLPGRDGAIQYSAGHNIEITDENVINDLTTPNSTDGTTAKLTKIKIAGINYALQGGGASVFANYEAMITEFNSKAASDLELGWNIYIRTIDVPDLWVSKNDETTSVPYTYTTDAQFITDLKTASTSGLQIGYYRVNQLEVEKVNVPVQDIQIDSASIVQGGVANIPLASGTNAGVSKGTASYGVTYDSRGFAIINKATDAEIEGKAVQYKPVVPSNLDKAIMEGLGNNSLTWSDTYKSNARTTIGAISSDDIPKGNATTMGIWRIGLNNGLTIDGQDGILKIQAANTSQIDALSDTNRPIVPATLQYAVDTGVKGSTNYSSFTCEMSDSTTKTLKLYCELV